MNIYIRFILYTVVVIFFFNYFVIMQNPPKVKREPKDWTAEDVLLWINFMA